MSKYSPNYLIILTNRKYFAAPSFSAPNYFHALLI